jgi:hypothetical protein
VCRQGLLRCSSVAERTRCNYEVNPPGTDMGSTRHLHPGIGFEGQRPLTLQVWQRMVLRRCYFVGEMVAAPYLFKILVNLSVLPEHSRLAVIYKNEFFNQPKQIFYLFCHFRFLKSSRIIFIYRFFFSFSYVQFTNSYLPF